MRVFETFIIDAWARGRAPWEYGLGIDSDRMRAAAQRGHCCRNRGLRLWREGPSPMEKWLLTPERWVRE